MQSDRTQKLISCTECLKQLASTAHEPSVNLRIKSVIRSSGNSDIDFTTIDVNVFCGETVAYSHLNLHGRDSQQNLKFVMDDRNGMWSSHIIVEVG